MESFGSLKKMAQRIGTLSKQEDNPICTVVTHRQNFTKAKATCKRY